MFRCGCFAIGVCLLGHGMADPSLLPPVSIKDASGLRLSPRAYPTWEQRKLILENGLEVLMISDPGANTAAAVSVGVGSIHEPPRLQGLAHFLEHMLLQSTKKYPAANDYYRFISDHGGKRNAYTDSDRTVYAMSIPQEALLEAMDRFAQFFVAPTFDEEAMARELQVIHQEFLRYRDSDAWRAQELLKHALNEEHPYHRFDIGTADTLKEIKRSDLMEFWSRYYTTDHMRLVIQSSLPMDDLQRIVNATFGAIPKRIGAPIPQPSTPLFGTRARGSFQCNHSHGGQRRLHLHWEMPPGLVLNQEQAPDWHLHRLLMSGHAGGLLDQLHQRGWIQGLHSATDRISTGQAMVTLVADLTQEGGQHWRDVATQIYAYLDILRRDPLPSAIQEQTILFALQQHLHRTRQDAFEEVMEQADQLLDESMASYPRLSLAPLEWHRHALRELLPHLQPAKGLHHLQLPTEELAIEMPDMEPWFQIPYSWRPLGEEDLVALTTPLAGEPMQCPRLNPLMASDFNVLSQAAPVKWTWPHPTLIESTDRAQIYWKLDETFGLPRSVLTLRWLSPRLDESLDATLYGDLVMLLLEQRLLSFSTLASAADLQLRYASAGDRIELQVSGLSHHAGDALLEMVRQLRHLQWTKEELSQACTELAGRYLQEGEDYPNQQARRILQGVLQPPFWSTELKGRALSQLDEESFTAWWHGCCDQVYVQALWYGNMGRDRAQLLTDRVHGILQSRPWSKAMHPPHQLVSVQEAKQLCLLRQPCTRPGQGLCLAIPLECRDAHDRAFLRIMTSALQEPFFSTLRSQQKTSYSLSTSFSEYRDRMGWLLFTQLSHSHRGLDLLGRDHAFLDGCLHEPGPFFSEERFESLRLGRLQLWERAFASQQEEVAWILRQAFEENGNFDLGDEMVEAFKAMRYEEVLEHWKAWMTQPQGEIAVWIDGPLDVTEAVVREYTPAGESQPTLNIVEVR